MKIALLFAGLALVVSGCIPTDEQCDEILRRYEEYRKNHPTSPVPAELAEQVEQCQERERQENSGGSITPQPPTTPPPDNENDDDRPGWGHGDRNHNHTGPPGKGGNKDHPGKGGK